MLSSVLYKPGLVTYKYLLTNKKSDTYHRVLLGLTGISLPFHDLTHGCHLCCKYSSIRLESRWLALEVFNYIFESGEEENQ